MFIIFDAKYIIYMKKRKTNISFFFGEGVRTHSGPAIYKISFSTGENYIGKAILLKNRITSHVTDCFCFFVKSPSLRKMVKYEGAISFEVIEYIEPGNPSFLRERELYHIKNHPHPDKRLNFCNRPAAV